MKRFLLAIPLALTVTALVTAPTFAWHRNFGLIPRHLCRSCCGVTIRPYNAFTPVCCGGQLIGSSAYFPGPFAPQAAAFDYGAYPNPGYAVPAEQAPAEEAPADQAEPAQEPEPLDQAPTEKKAARLPANATPASSSGPARMPVGPLQTYTPPQGYYYYPTAYNPWMYPGYAPQPWRVPGYIPGR
jgi:hypothetical protein